VNLGGQMLANSMGLSFAFNLDPQRGGSSSTPALGQLFTLLVTMTFLALDGHLSLIQTLVQSFNTLPLAGGELGSAGLHSVVAWGGSLFTGALAIALPGITALLVVHLGFGVVSRAAPALNLFAVGLPVALLCGLVVILAGLFSVQATFIHGLDQGFRMLGSLVGAKE
jgi:flagellar biosynthetic protein FliR